MEFDYIASLLLVLISLWLSVFMSLAVEDFSDRFQSFSIVFVPQIVVIWVCL